MFVNTKHVHLVISDFIVQYILRVIGVSLVLFLMLISISPVMAKGNEITIFSISQNDLDDDGQPDITIIDCPFATKQDRIYVVDQGGDMQVSNDWQEATDFNNDIWLYDIGADGSVQLVVVYRVEEGRETAYLYDDQDGDGQVMYEMVGTRVAIRESPYWSARIVSSSTWFLSDSRLNLNVHIEFDGPVAFYNMPEKYGKEWMKNDGQVDAEFEEVTDPDGIARYALKRLLSPSPAGLYFQRTALWSNEGRNPTNPFTRAFFPFLPAPIESSDIDLANLRLFDFPPDIIVDWLNGKILTVRLDGTSIGHGYFCNDFSYLEKGQVNDVSHECPLANYDLAENHDAFPELNIRMFYYPAGDIALPLPIRSLGAFGQEIYYSWNLFDLGTLNWDYKLGLAGNYQIDKVEQFPDFAIRKVPFAEFPDWITERPWKLTTFVARENRDYTSTEGIWVWNPLAGPDPVSRGDLTPEVREAGLQYMLGISSTSPDGYFKRVNQGFRAERNFADSSNPNLYFSPVDHKLHLQGAQWGIWNIDDYRTVEYRDRDNDGYMDEWLFLKGNQVHQQVNLIQDYLIYMGNEEVVIKKASISPAQFQSTPPRNHEEWVEQRNILDANRVDFEPEDFDTMINQFPGPVTNIEGATLRDYHPTEKGFRFVLQLHPGFTTDGEDWLDLLEKPPGEFVVSYDGEFQIQAVTPPDLSIWINRSTFDEAFQSYIGSEIYASIHNSGLEDARQVLVDLGTNRSGQEIAWTEPQTVTVLAGETTPVRFQWVPDSSGKWNLQIRARMLDSESALDQDDKAEQELVSLEVKVKSSLADSLQFISLGGAVRSEVILALVGVSALAGAAFLLLFRKEI